MARVKKGMNALKTRRNILKQAKGFRFGRSKKEKQAHEALAHAGAYAFAHRRDKKGDMRSLAIVRVNAALGEVSYSKFMGMMKKKGVEINRKVLAELAVEQPATFKKIVEFVS